MKGFCWTFVTLLLNWFSERFFKRLNIICTYILINSNSRCWNIVNWIRHKRISMTFVSSVQYQLILPASWVLITTRPELCNLCSIWCSNCRYLAVSCLKNLIYMDDFFTVGGYANMQAWQVEWTHNHYKTSTNAPTNAHSSNSLRDSIKVFFIPISSGEAIRPCKKPIWSITTNSPMT